jgi:hypothetical protein
MARSPTGPELRTGGTSTTSATFTSRARPRVGTSRADATQHCFKRTDDCRYMRRRQQAVRLPIATLNDG